MWHSYMTWPAPDEPTYPPRRSFFFQAEDGIRDWSVTGVQTCALPIWFVTEQIAGDMLPSATPYQKVATGFCRNNRSVTEAGSIEEEWRTENVIDRVETTSAVLLGLRSEERRVGKEWKYRGWAGQ